VQAQAGPHVLACKSFIMGTCNLLIVGLPGGWRVQAGPFPPEVDHWRDFGGVTWALVGRGSYRAYGPPAAPATGPGSPAGASPAPPAAASPGAQAPGRLQAAVLHVRVGRLEQGDAAALADARRALHRVHASGEAPFGGHPGTWALGEVAQGFGPWRRPLPALALGAACPSTGRAVQLLVECPSQEALEAMLEANRACWACH